MKLVGVGHPRAGTPCQVHNLRAVVLIAMQCDVGIDFQAVGYCRLAVIIAGDGLKYVTDKKE